MFALVVGALADTIGFSPLFAVLAVFDLLGAVVIWTVLKTNRQTTTRRRSKRVNRPRKARSMR
jgi:ACS family hexuronate transporter-like MFS transporter